VALETLLVLPALSAPRLAGFWTDRLDGDLENPA
jgi:hypothetical protein